MRTASVMLLPQPQTTPRTPRPQAFLLGSQRLPSGLHAPLPLGCATGSYPFQQLQPGEYSRATMIISKRAGCHKPTVLTEISIYTTDLVCVNGSHEMSQTMVTVKQRIRNTFSQNGYKSFKIGFCYSVTSVICKNGCSFSAVLCCPS